VLYPVGTVKISQRDIAAYRIEQFRTFEVLARAVELRTAPPIVMRLFVVWFPECSGAVTLGLSA
jgi:hypothetical protein